MSLETCERVQTLFRSEGASGRHHNIGRCRPIAPDLAPRAFRNIGDLFGEHGNQRRRAEPAARHGVVVSLRGRRRVNPVAEGAADRLDLVMSKAGIEGNFGNQVRRHVGRIGRVTQGARPSSR